MGNMTLAEARELFADCGVDDVKMRVVRGNWQFVVEAQDAVGVGCHADQEVALLQALTTFGLSRKGGR
jgi:ribosomal protein S12 methylthiotransferase accessory factor YcaO